MFAWNDRYSVRIHSIDAQHQSLFAIAQELYQAMSTGQGKLVTGRILDRLVTYTSSHFAHEERLMQARGYPDFEVHKAQHDSLRKQVLGFQSDFKAGRVAMTVQLLQFLRDWLTGHIDKSDRKYAPYLKNS